MRSSFGPPPVLHFASFSSRHPWVCKRCEPTNTRTVVNGCLSPQILLTPSNILASGPAPSFQSAEQALGGVIQDLMRCYDSREHSDSNRCSEECCYLAKYPALRRFLRAPAISAEETRQGRCLIFPRENNVYACGDIAITWLVREVFLQAARLCGSQISLSDLHHGHLWYDQATRRAGLLLHAREYPLQNEKFPYELGYCQKISDLSLSCTDEMRRRNVVWVLGDRELHLLNPDGLILPELVGIYTVDEGVFGRRLADLYYFGRNPARFRADLYIVPFL